MPLKFFKPLSSCCELPPLLSMAQIRLHRPLMLPITMPMCEKPSVGDVGNASGTRVGLVPPAWLYARTSSQHAPSAFSRYTPCRTTPLAVVTSVTPDAHHASTCRAQQSRKSQDEMGMVWTLLMRRRLCAEDGACIRVSAATG